MQVLQLLQKKIPVVEQRGLMSVNSIVRSARTGRLCFA